MEFADVMKLVNAGFNAEQIAAMAGDPKQDPKQDLKQDPKQDPKRDPKQDPKQEPSIRDVMQEMKEIREDMQRIALLGTSQKHNQNENVDQILAAIINPQQKQEDK